MIRSLFKHITSRFSTTTPITAPSPAEMKKAEVAMHNRLLTSTVVPIRRTRHNSGAGRLFRTYRPTLATS